MMRKFDTLRFPENVAEITAVDGGFEVNPTNQKRYFEIIVKELDTATESILKMVGLGKRTVEDVNTDIAEQEKIKQNARNTTAKQNADKKIAELNEEKQKLSNSTSSSTEIKTLTSNDSLLSAPLKSNVDDVGRSVFGFALPLPNELTESLTHSWSSMETVQATFLGTVVDGLGINKLISQMSNDVIRKPAIDPGYFQDYKSTEPRTFTFSWDLIPRNDREAKTIREIIINLKKYTLPSKGIDGFTLVSPRHFDITFGNELFSDMVNMKGLVCTNMQVDYSADGTMQMTSDGMPKYIKLTLSFSERRALYSEDYTPGGLKQ